MAPLSMTSPISNDHPITPPKHLLSHWTEVINYGYSPERIEEMLTEAARWGANEELEACCADLLMVLGPNHISWLRSVRRPKPPSLKEQAQRILVENGTTTDGRMELDPDDIGIILRALEALPE
jgi:hypothetical protein